MHIANAPTASAPYSRLQSAIGWATLAMIMATTLAFGGNAPAYWVLFSTAVFALFTLQLGLLFLRGEHPSTRSLLLPGLIYALALAWGMIQIMQGLPPDWHHPAWQALGADHGHISAAPTARAHSVLRLAAYALVFWIAVQSARNRKRALGFMRTIALFSGALAFFGIAAAFTGQNPILGDNASSAVSASFVNRNSYATFASFDIYANLFMFHKSISTGSSDHHPSLSQLRIFLENLFAAAWVYLFGALLGLGALMLSLSRAGVMAGLLGLLVFMALIKHRATLKRAFLLVVALVLVPLILVVSGGVLDRIAQTDGSDLRLQVYRTMIEQLPERWLTGHGLGAFRDSCAAYLPPEAAAAQWSYAHNSYLENLWELGLPAAFCLYLALVLVLWPIARHAARHEQGKSYAVMALACSVAAGLHALFDFSMQMPAIAALFAFTLGMGWAQSTGHTRQRSGAI